METTGPWASTLVRADEAVPGRWHADVDDIWTAAMVPLGGLSAAVAARAMVAELAAQHPGSADQRLRSVHCLFAAPVPAGDLEADVTVLRAGRSMSQVQVDLHAPGASVGLHGLAAFGAARTGYEFLAASPPDVPRPEDCRSYRDPPPPDAEWEVGERMPLWAEILEGRGAIGLPPWDRSPRTTAESATWYRFDDPPLGPDGRLDPLALLVVGDMMLGSVGQRIGYSDHQWFGPSVDLTMHLFSTPRPGWLLSHNKAHIATDGYASIETLLWDLDGARGIGVGDEATEPQLVAYATQQMFFAFPDGPPPPDQLRL